MGSFNKSLNCLFNIPLSTSLFLKISLGINRNIVNMLIIVSIIPNMADDVEFTNILNVIREKEIKKSTLINTNDIMYVFLISGL